jgi:hypothetical protein
MTSEELPIEASTKVGALLDRYPELEDVLINAAAPFKKLRNPILRNSIGKVASLQQAAAVAGLPISGLLNELRAEVGQPLLPAQNDEARPSYFPPKPQWFDASKLVGSIDEQIGGDPDKMTLTRLSKAAAELNPGEMVELNTTFLPAPGIDIMKKKGFLVWSSEESPEIIKTYVAKPNKPA